MNAVATDQSMKTTSWMSMLPIWYLSSATSLRRIAQFLNTSFIVCSSKAATTEIICSSSWKIRQNAALCILREVPCVLENFSFCIVNISSISLSDTEYNQYISSKTQLNQWTIVLKCKSAVSYHNLCSLKPQNLQEISNRFEVFKSAGYLI